MGLVLIIFPMYVYILVSFVTKLYFFYILMSNMFFLLVCNNIFFKKDIDKQEPIDVYHLVYTDMR